MKIRITKKGLPKAQFGPQLGPQFGAQANPAFGGFNWELPQTTFPTPPAPQNPMQTMELQQYGDPVQNQGPIVPIKKYKAGEWMPANQSKLQYAVNKFVQTPVMQTLQNIGNITTGAVNILDPIMQGIDSHKKNKAIERAYKQSLVSSVPTDTSENRGDYELNTGILDPYNMGAKSKGQFAGMYYTRQFQPGGSTERVRPNIGEGFMPDPISMPKVSTDNTFVKKPYINNSEPVANYSKDGDEDLREFIAAKESKGRGGYQALPYKNGRLVSSATGKYQFLWNKHSNWITKITGVHSKEEFLKSPDAQEIAFSYWDRNVLTPAAAKIQEELGVDAPINQIKAKVHFSGAQGAYDYYATGKEVQDAFGTTTSSYAEGGQTDNSMKIRITKGPMENMAYGGQLGYGFDLGGRRVYTDEPEGIQDTVGNTLGPVPREEATLEAEKGEVYVGDVDNDGMDEHMTIGGKRHSEGGTPLNVDKGFIYSDTKKLKIKDPEILKRFGKSYQKGGITPAVIAKQYPTNKYKAILQDPHADPIAKRTAEMMLDNHNKKLAELALVQEGMKGFPQGIPEIAQGAMQQPMAKYGGDLPGYQTAGQTPPKYSKQEFDALFNQKDPIKGSWEMIGDRLAQRRWSVPGAPSSTTITKPAGPAPGKGSDAFNRAFAAARAAGRPTFPFNGKQYTTNIYNPKGTTTVQTKPGAPVEKLEQMSYDEVPVDNTTTTPPGEKGNPVNPNGFTPSGNNIPYGWTQQDRNNWMLAANNYFGLKKYPSVRRDINPVLPDFRNMDWRGRAAELQGQYNSTLNTMGTYGSPTGLAANASFMAGQQAENLINKAIDPVEQQNVGIYNQVSGQRAGIMNQAIENSANNRFLRSQDRAVLNQQYDNAKRDALKAWVMTQNQGITNAAGIYNTNLTESPYYYFDPRTQRMQFNSPGAKAAFEASIRNAGPNDGDMAAKYVAISRQLKGSVPDNDLHDAVIAVMGLNPRSRAAGSQTTYPFNPRMNRVTTPVVGDPNNPSQ